MTMTETLIYDPAKKLNSGCIMSFILNTNSLHYICTCDVLEKKINQFDVIYKYLHLLVSLL